MNLSILGRLHPLLVHLPIGVLVMAFLFELLSHTRKYRKLKSAVRPAMLLGALSAVAAAFTGYWLSKEGGYDERLLRIHQYLGFGLAGFSILVWVHRKYSIIHDKANRRSVRMALFFVLLGLTIATGHFGASLTHGEDYLLEAGTAGQPGAVSSTKVVGDPMQAFVFNDLIKPVFEQKCYGCHSSKKQKGQLRLDAEELIVKGGKHGSVVRPGNPEQSELYKRITIPLEVEHHMPPRERDQLTLAEIELFHWWIREGATFNKQVRELQEPEQAIEFLTSRQVGVVDDYLSKEIGAADEPILVALRKSGVVILPVASTSNYLRVSFMEKVQISPEEIELLKSIQANIVELEITESQLSTETMRAISELRELRKLSLRKSVIGDRDITLLASLENLIILNLTSTGISDEGLKSLGDIHSLRKVYLYQTAVTKKGIENLHQLIPALQIDTGNYHLPLLASDTTVYKAISGKR